MKNKIEKNDLKFNITKDGYFELFNGEKKLGIKDLQELLGEDPTWSLFNACEIDYYKGEGYKTDATIEFTKNALKENGFSLSKDNSKNVELIYCVDKEAKNDYIIIASKSFFEKHGYLNDHYTSLEREKISELEKDLPVFESMESYLEYEGKLEEIITQLENKGVKYSSKLDSFINKH